MNEFDNFESVKKDPDFKEWASKELDKKKASKTSYNLLKIGLIILGVFCLGLLYLIYSGYTKSEITCPSDSINFTCSDIQIPKCPDFPDIKFNQSCNCVFPNNLTINLRNGS